MSLKLNQFLARPVCLSSRVPRAGAGRLMMGDATYNHVFSDTQAGDLTRRLAAGEMPGTEDLLAAADCEGLPEEEEEADEEAPPAPGTVQGDDALDALLGAMMDNMDPRAPSVGAQDTPTGAAAACLGK